MGKKITHDEAIVLFKEVHGDRYDYTNTKYLGALSPIEVLCKAHGTFKIIANNHKLGFGCRQCKKEEKLNLIFDGFRAVHGDHYDYSESKYIADNKKIRIRCPQHGYFEKLALTHRKGGGCDLCEEKIRDTDSLIKAFRRVHGHRYDYSQVVFTSSTAKVNIVCTEHGVFPQTIHRHLDYQGCPVCAGIIKKSNEQIIAEFKEKHGDRYDYSLVEYDGNNKKVRIICKEHGEFLQTPKAHKKSSGCPSCRVHLKKVSDKIPAFKQVHGERYNYDLCKNTTYICSHVKIAIKCAKHGVFKQSIASHGNGSGCPSCAKERRRQLSNTCRPQPLKVPSH